jgi:hypothetical protein
LALSNYSPAQYNEAMHLATEPTVSKSYIRIHSFSIKPGTKKIDTGKERLRLLKKM